MYKWSIRSRIFQSIFAHPDNIRLQAQLPIIKNYLNKKVDRAIDIGCGTGRFTKLLTKIANDTIAVDINFNHLKRIKSKKIDAELIQADISTLPIKNEKFDLALLIEVLEHIDDDKKALKESGRILKNGGKIIISVPMPPPPYPDLQHKRCGYTQKQIFDLIEDNEFNILAHKFCMFRIARQLLKLSIKFIQIFKFPPPILFLIKIEKYVKKGLPFSIIINAEKCLTSVS